MTAPDLEPRQVRIHGPIQEPDRTRLLRLDMRRERHLTVEFRNGQGQRLLRSGATLIEVVTDDPADPILRFDLDVVLVLDEPKLEPKTVGPTAQAIKAGTRRFPRYTYDGLVLRNRQIMEESRKGLGPKEIAGLHNLSTTSIGRILKAARGRGEL